MPLLRIATFPQYVSYCFQMPMSWHSCQHEDWMVLVVTSTVRDSVSSSGALNPKHDLFLTLTKCFLCLNITRAPNISLVCRNVSFANICPADWVGSFALVFISLNSFLYLFNYVFFFSLRWCKCSFKAVPMLPTI